MCVSALMCHYGPLVSGRPGRDSGGSHRKGATGHVRRAIVAARWRSGPSPLNEVVSGAPRGPVRTLGRVPLPSAEVGTVPEVQ